MAIQFKFILTTPVTKIQSYLLQTFPRDKMQEMKNQNEITDWVVTSALNATSIV